MHCLLYMARVLSSSKLGSKELVFVVVGSILDTSLVEVVVGKEKKIVLGRHLSELF